MSEEQWRTILEFPNYDISSFGRVYNKRRDIMMSASINNFGHVKLTFTDYLGDRHTRSVAQLVADAFVEPPNLMCDQLIVLDGDLSNIDSKNLAWRPRWFAWKYTRQLKERQPTHYHNLAVLNLSDDVEYESIVQAGMTEGLLFENIWQSTYTGVRVFPNGSVFGILE